MTDSFEKRTTLLSRLKRTLAAPAALALVLGACSPPEEEEVPDEPDIEETVDDAGDAAEEMADEVEDAADEVGEAAEEIEEDMDEPEEDMSEEDTQ